MEVTSIVIVQSYIGNYIVTRIYYMYDINIHMFIHTHIHGLYVHAHT